MTRPRISLAEGLAAHLSTRAKAVARAAPTAMRPRRLKVWEVRGSLQCSIVGTCLSHGDLIEIVRKCGLEVEPGTTDYSLHGYFSQAIATDNTVSRAVQKLLDRRHEGIVRRFARADSEAELGELWGTEFAAGRIPGAYWAVTTFDHIPAGLHTRGFGEVHMLSHVLGRTAHAGAARSSELESRVADLEARLLRIGERHAAALDERDRRIAALEHALAAQKIGPGTGKAPPEQASGAIAHRHGRDDRRERALAIARARARVAEAEVERLRSLQATGDRVRRGRPRAIAAASIECPGVIACRLALPAGDKLRVLYLGGRNGAIEQLRAIAESAGAELLHHDGGIEHAPSRVEDLVQRSHVVFCPVDCVSHQACLRAKHACQRLRRHFVPLRSAGAATFARAISGVEIVESKT